MSNSLVSWSFMKACYILSMWRNYINKNIEIALLSVQCALFKLIHSYVHFTNVWMSKVSESPLLKCDTIHLTVYLEIILNIQKTCNIVQRTFVYPLLGLISCSHFCLTCFIIVDIYMSVYLSTLFFFLPLYS